MVNVFVTNLGAYNNGELIGEWLSMPYEEEEFAALLDRIGNPEEVFITDYESDCGIEIGEYEYLPALNEKTKTLEMVDADLITALMEIGETLEDALEIAEAERYIFYPGQTVADVAVDYVETMQLPELALRYFDYEALERDLGFDGWHDTEVGAIQVF